MTTFIVLLYVSAIVLIAAPIFLVKFYGKKWKLSGGIFWKAGLTGLLIDFFILAVLGNASSLWPELWKNSILVNALAVAIVSGLFAELGKFLVLDKIFKQLRSFKEAAFFAMGNVSLVTMIMGIMLIIGAAGMQFMVSSGNLAELVPNADTQEIKNIEEMKRQTIPLMAENPFLALSPVIERGSKAAINLSLTMLILLALVKGETRYVWMAAAMRALITFTGVLIGSLGAPAGDLAYLVLALFSLFAVNQVRIKLPKQLK
jgi:uncharacterized membrane protein YhfC